MRRPESNPTPKAAFTLLELMVAMVILTIAMGIAFQAFSGTIRAWRRGTEVIDGIKHGDYAITELTAALYSTIYFTSPRKIYAFDIEKDVSDGFPADRITFVTASGAFMPPDSPFAEGPHRIKLFIDADDYGDPALFVQAMPAIADYEDYEDEYDNEPMLVSASISGLEILFWDKELEDWIEEWEKENAIPERILLTLFVDSDDEDEEPIEFTRVIEIPTFDSMKLKLQGPSQSPQAQGGRTGRNRNSSRGGNNPQPRITVPK